MPGRPTVAPADADIPGTPMDPDFLTQIIKEVSTFEAEPSRPDNPAGIPQAAASKDAGAEFGAACNRELFSAHCELDGMTHSSGMQQADTCHFGWIVTCQIATSPGGDSLDTPETGITPEILCAAFVGLVRPMSCAHARCRAGAWWP